MKKLRFIAASGVKKVVSLSMVCLMALSLGGCGGNTAVSGQSKITTESFSTMTEEKLTVPDHTQKIDDGAVLPDATIEAETTEETTEAETPAVNNGSYSYTIYDGIEVTLPFDIDDYVITNSEGIQGVLFFKMATDYGWVPLDEDHSSDFYYNCGDYYTYFSLEDPYTEECNYAGSSDDFEVYPIKSCQLWFSPPNEPGEFYFDTVAGVGANSSIELDYDMRYDNCQYLYFGAKANNTALSKDDVIIVAYLLTFVNSNPEGGNPLYYLDLPDSVGIGGSGALVKYDLP